MKNLIVSLICLLVLIVPWEIYDYYATRVVKDYCYTLEEHIIPAIENNDWTMATKGYGNIVNNWEKFKTISEYFINAEVIHEADELIYKTKQYIIMKDSSNASATSSQLCQTLQYLHENEMLSIGNVL